MDLYLLRHGEAGEHGSYADDSKRPLTAEGIEMMRRQATTLKAWNLSIDLILSSPYTRARQTADIVAETFGLTVVNENRLQSGFRIADARQIIEDHSTVQNLWLTGHQPDLSDVLSAIVGGGNFRFEKGGLACIKIEKLTVPRGSLRWLLTPSLMGAAG